MTILRKIYFAAAIGLLGTGCSQVPVVYTFTSGSHVRSSDEELLSSQKEERRKFVVWGNHPGAVNSAIELIQQYGGSVVERAQLRTIFDEQKITLTHGSEDANVLSVGKLAGADQVIFVETTERSESFTPPQDPIAGFFRGMAATGAAMQGKDPPPDPKGPPVYRPRVTVRAVRVETSEIVWTGSSTLSQGVSVPELAIPLLTKAAIIRANCRLERGAEFIEFATDGSRQPWGCIRK